MTDILDVKLKAVKQDHPERQDPTWLTYDLVFVVGEREVTIGEIGITDRDTQITISRWVLKYTESYKDFLKQRGLSVEDYHR